MGDEVDDLAEGGIAYGGAGMLGAGDEFLLALVVGEWVVAVPRRLVDPLGSHFARG